MQPVTVDTGTHSMICRPAPYPAGSPEPPGWSAKVERLLAIERRARRQSVHGPGMAAGYRKAAIAHRMLVELMAQRPLTAPRR